MTARLFVWWLRPAWRRFGDFLVWWFVPPNPRKDGTLQAASDEVADIDFESIDLEIRKSLLQDAKDTVALMQGATDRADRKSFALLPLALSLVTAIMAGIGTRTLGLASSTPSLCIAIFSVVELAVALLPTTLSVPQIDKQLRSAEAGNWPQGITATLHSTASYHRKSLRWRTGHLACAIWSLIAAVVLMLIPILARLAESGR